MQRSTFPYKLHLVILFVIVPILVVPATAQVIEHKLTASDAAEADFFGNDVALSGDRALISANFDDDQGDRSGSAYIFERQADGTWAETAKLTASDGAAMDNFGVAVALSGDYAVVGANSVAGSTGAVYIFERQADGTWPEVTKLAPADVAPQGQFGFSVSVLGDRILVGVASDDTGLGSGSGSAYVFERQADGTWLEMDKLTASDGTRFDNFGFAVSLSGNRALVSSYGDNGGAGSAYIFERQADGTWLEMDKLTASDPAPSNFLGISASLSGNTALLGSSNDDDLGSRSGSAYIFERQSDGTWLETHKLNASNGATLDFFGFASSLSGDHALVGAYGVGEFVGSAYLFERQTDGTWVEINELTASDQAEQNAQGFSVSLSGNRSLVGAYSSADGTGAAYIYENLFPVAIERTEDLPRGYTLSRLYPNPFRETAQFSLTVPETRHVRIEVVNMLGQQTAILHDALLAGPGTHRFTIEAGSWPGGVYLVRITSATFATTRTITRLK
jgi:hypothetical protein